MQQIVLVIKAQTSGEVQDILDRIGINKDSSDKCEVMSEQLFLVTIKRSKQIDPQIYVKINENLKTISRKKELKKNKEKDLER